MSRCHRIILGIGLVFLLAFCGFVVTGFVAATFFVPVNSGLAGPAIVVAYGLLGAVVVAIAGAVMFFRLPARWSVRLAIIVLIASILLAGVMVRAWLQGAGVERPVSAPDPFPAMQKKTDPAQPAL